MSFTAINDDEATLPGIQSIRTSARELVWSLLLSYLLPF